MLIIFGMRSKVKNLGTMLVVCRLCNTPAANRLIRVDRWLTLFFIRIVPVSRKYRLTCTFCGGTISISKEDALQFAEAAQVQAYGQGAPGFPASLAYPGQPAPGSLPMEGALPVAGAVHTDDALAEAGLVPVPHSADVAAPMDGPATAERPGGDPAQPASVASRPGNWPQMAPKPMPRTVSPFTFPAAPRELPVTPPTVSDEP